VDNIILPCLADPLHLVACHPEFIPSRFSFPVALVVALVASLGLTCGLTTPPQQQDGKPYLLEASASKLYSDPRSQGFTVAGKTRFASIEDMKYYDEECEGHAALKKVVGPLQQGVLSVYMDE